MNPSPKLQKVRLRSLVGKQTTFANLFSLHQHAEFPFYGIPMQDKINLSTYYAELIG
jgi:hypothetical protein